MIVLRSVSWVILAFILGSASSETLTIGYITGSERKTDDFMYSRPGRAISGAISLAVDEINENQELLPTDTLKFAVAETFGDSAESLKQTAQLWEKNVSAVIGPQETCICEAKLAGALDIPMISYFCPASEVSDKTKFPTFARTRPPASQISESVATLLHRFDWTNVVILNNDEENFADLASETEKTLIQSGIDVADRRVWRGNYYHNYMENPFVHLVDDTYSLTRVYVVIGHSYEYIGLMAYLDEKNLLRNGAFFVIGIHDEYYSEEKPDGYIKGIFDQFPDANTINAFRFYMGVAISPPTHENYEKFSETVNVYLEKPPFNFVNPFKMFGIANKHIKLRPEAAYLNDAVYLYAYAVTQARKNDEDPTSGKILIKHMKGHSFRSANGYETYMDENNDVIGNFTVISLGEDEQGKPGLFPIGTFHRKTNKDISQKYHYEVDFFHPLRWMSGYRPAPRPLCGFRGEDCINRNVIGFADERV